MPERGALGLNCRSVHKWLDEKEERHNRLRLILRNAISKALLRLSTFGYAFRFAQMIPGLQHEIVEIPAKGFEAFEEITTSFSEVRSLNSAPHVLQHVSVADVEE